MSNLVRRSWNNRGGADPALWEKPVNQASKWLAAKSGAQRILSQGGTASLTNNESRIFLLNVWVGDGGAADVGGTSGNNTIRITRTGNTVSVTCQLNSGATSTKMFTTSVGADRWSNVYLKATQSGLFQNQITITAMVDFNTTQTVHSAVSSYLTTNGKTLTCNSLSGWAWFGSLNGGFFGWGATSTIPITDVKYREAFINNATWDLDTNTGQHNWSRPPDLRTMRAWIIQGSGGYGGPGGDGGPGAKGNDGSSSQPDSCSWGDPGGSGGDGGDGGKGGNNGSNGSSGRAGSPGSTGSSPSYRYGEYGDDPNKITSCSGGSGGQGGSGGGGGAGGTPGRGVMKQVTFTQDLVPCKVGAKGTNGTPGSNGSSGSGNGGDGGDGTDGAPGGNGIHTVFGSETTAGSTIVSTPTIKFGATEFEHGCGGPGQDGGVVMYLMW